MFSPLFAQRLCFPRKSYGSGDCGEPSIARMFASRSIRDLILWCVRRGCADTEICKRRPESGVCARSGSDVTWLGASALPVGLFVEAVYQGQAVPLSPGDLIVAYTDGFVEATTGQAKNGESRVSCRRKTLPDAAAGEHCRSCICSTREIFRQQSKRRRDYSRSDR